MPEEVLRVVEENLEVYLGEGRLELRLWLVVAHVLEKGLGVETRLDGDAQLLAQEADRILLEGPEV